MKRASNRYNKAEHPYKSHSSTACRKKAVKKRLLTATNDISQTTHTYSTFLTVGTPSRVDGSIDLTSMERATEELGTALREKQSYHLVSSGNSERRTILHLCGRPTWSTQRDFTIPMNIGP
ncbi:hypothetical protein E6H12_00650 [Candidatus Bathyarchaeota archaeon]|nr:MAG: hypothetical protein E6H12_00650 [Candidatus Bathyarchaeota archaeon]